MYGNNFTHLPPDLINGQEEYEVEVILSHKWLGRGYSYLIKWKGYSSSDNSWKPEWNIQMHRNSSLYTNNDINSNKENIPPTHSYPMPSNTQSAKQWALNQAPLQGISLSPDPNNIVITTSPEPTPELTRKALIKRTRNCPLCRLPSVYDHIAWCCGLTDGYTCHCHREVSTHEPAPSETNTIETPISLTTVQQLDEFYPDKASYLSFWTKVINEPSFTTFNYSYHSHWSLKHQIQMTEGLLSSLRTMDETHVTAVEAALLRMHKEPLSNKIFSKTTTTYLHNVFPCQKWRNTYPQRKVSFLTPGDWIVNLLWVSTKPDYHEQPPNLS